MTKMLKNTVELKHKLKLKTVLYCVASWNWRRLIWFLQWYTVLWLQCAL